MLFYLSRKETADIFDPVFENIKARKIKCSSEFLNFITVDMKRYTSCRVFLLERKAIEESDDNFIGTLKSFQLMSEARVIVICEMKPENDVFFKNLTGVGINDFITADNDEGKQKQLLRILDNGTADDNIDVLDIDAPISAKGIANSIISRELEKETYRFDCLNTRIAVAGATRRVGTTTTAFNFANWLFSHGASVCYIQCNPSNHLNSIAKAHEFSNQGAFYNHNGVDYYDSDPDVNYNFLVCDFGVINNSTLRLYGDFDVRLLCGTANLPHEIADFSEAYKQVKMANPTLLTLKPNEELKDYFDEAFKDAPAVVQKARGLFDHKTNHGLFKPLIQEWIVETGKRF